jgi:hypothetical protein
MRERVTARLAELSHPPTMNRSQKLSVLGGFVAALGATYACSSSSTPSNGGPPVNEDSGPGTDGSPNTTPDGSGGNDGVAPPGDSSTGDSAAPPPACASLPGTPVYIESGDTQQALLDHLGRQLRDQANITIIFQLTGSCTLSPNIYGTGSGPVPIPANTVMSYIPSTAENPSWAPGMPEPTCTTGSATPTPDLAIAALFPSSCASLVIPSNTNVAQYLGPRQAYTFIVPPAEFTGGETAITAKEAYYAFGNGATNALSFGGNPEWNDPTQFFLRPTTKSTLVSTALNIGLTPAQMADSLPDGGTNDGRKLEPSSTAVVSAVAAATSSVAIGILGDEVYDQNRSKVSVLALQDTFHGQTAAYYPDSTQTSFDKQNIRDGHYSLWSPDVYMAPSTGTPPQPTNPNVKFILDIVLGNPGATLPDGGATTIDGISITASVGLTPSCAMQVTRASDGAPLTPYTPSAPCTCKFLSAVPGASDAGLPASCTTCTTSTDCPDAGSYGCFNGYCEAMPVAPTSDGGAACVTGSIENGCTNAQAVYKTVTYGNDLADGGLGPVTQ